MPWSKVTDHEDCDGIAVVKDSTGEVEGCHETEGEADEQIAALNASEDDRAVSDIDTSPPKSVVTAAQVGLDAKDRLDLSDCGTGEGMTTARQIVNDELGPSRVREAASYLSRHEDEYPWGTTPSSLSDEQLTDGCGTVQYLLWGGGSASANNWLMQTANKIAEEEGDEPPYTDSDMRSMMRADVSELSSGTLVTWGPSDARRYGEVIEVHTEGSVTSDSDADDETTMDASEENPVVEIQHWQSDGDEWTEGDIATVHRADSLEIIDSLPERSMSRDYEGRSYQSRIVDPEIRQTADGKVTVMVSTDDIARDGMVLDPEGIRTDDYLRNPVVLWEHGSHPQGGSTPIGRATNLAQKENGYLATVEFDDGDPFASEIKRKVENGFINAVSIGWRTEEIERQQRNGETVPVVTEADMTEFSFVGVPADTNALVQSRMHYADEPMARTEFQRVCEGLMCLEAVRRMDSDMTHKQAYRSVKEEVRSAVSGGLDAVRHRACPFGGAAMPMREFENLASVVQADAALLMRAAEVDGCTYDTQDEDRTATSREEDTSSSPSASPDTSEDAERDESPGNDTLTRSEAMRLIQDIAPQLASIRQQNAKHEAQKRLGIR